MTDTLFSPAEQAILARRAQELAHVTDADEETAEHIEVLTFQLGDERYALEVAYILEVRPLERFTPVPCAPDFIVGVTNLHGEILPLVDLRRILEVAHHGVADMMHIVVVDGMGLLAHRIGEVSWLPRSDFEDSHTPTIQGVSVDGLTLLALDVIVQKGQNS